MYAALREILVSLCHTAIDHPKTATTCAGVVMLAFVVAAIAGWIPFIGASTSQS